MNIKNIGVGVLSVLVAGLVLTAHQSTLTSVLMLVTVALLVSNLYKGKPLSEEAKNEILNKKYPETIDTFESFISCGHSSNPSKFHRCPRPYDARYDDSRDVCIYCGKLG
jgi:hypothetical protein